MEPRIAVEATAEHTGEGGDRTGSSGEGSGKIDIDPAGSGVARNSTGAPCRR